jgi:hypothetical protein
MIRSTSEGALPRRIFLAVAVLSLAVLMLQIALNRIFSFTIWYHFAYISVSLALLGFGASGAMLAAFPGIGGTSLTRTVGLYSALCALTTVLMLLVVGGIPLHPFAVLQSEGEFAKLVLYFIAVSVPFFFAGLAIAIALRAAGPEVHRLYFWDLIGAGLGCVLAVQAMNGLGGPRVVLLVAVLFAAAGMVASAGSSPAVWKANLALGALLLTISGPLPELLPFAPSQDKDIAHWLQKGSVYDSRWSALFRTDLIGGASGEVVDGGYRDQGISPRFRGGRPPFRMIFHDGGASAIMYQSTRDVRGLSMFRHHVLTAPYVVTSNPDVLIIGVGGGADVVNGLQNGAKSITGAELNPVTVDLITRKFRGFSGGIYDRPEVTIVPSEGRHFVRSTDRRFDLIQLSGVDTLAALSSGAYVLAENHLYTVEAYGWYFRALRDDGLLSMAGVDFHPQEAFPRHTMRWVAVSYEALRQAGAQNPHEHVMVLASGRPMTEVEVLTRKRPFTEAEIGAMEHFADVEGLETWYLPNRPARQLDLLRTLLEGSPTERQAFFRDTFLDLRATTDDRPFFFSFYKWRHLFEHRDEIDVGHTLATGQIVLVLLLGLAILFSAVTIALPMIRVRGAAASMPGRLGFLTYFAALGAGFIFAEISFVQRFILFLGYPTYSLTVMLFSFLTAAGIGARLSGGLPDRPASVLPTLVGALTAMVLFYVFVLPTIFERLAGASVAVRVATTVALCTPLGGLLGMFFPYGIRLTSAIDRKFVAWAWAVNGCLTVVGSVLSIMIAITYGFTVVISLCLAIYWLGALSFVRTYGRVAAPVRRSVEATASHRQPGSP